MSVVVVVVDSVVNRVAAAARILNTVVGDRTSGRGNPVRPGDARPGNSHASIPPRICLSKALRKYAHTAALSLDP